MTEYFVRKTGNDSNNGEDKTTAWLTIDHAANNVVAGDIVHIGAGVYRELVTMDTPGSSGSPIKFMADITGEHTDDAGLVFVSAHNDESSAVARTMSLDMNAKTFIEWHYVQFIGGSSQTVGNTTNASHVAYEGCRFENCLFQSSPAGQAFRIEINNGATPAADGLTMIGCRIHGGMRIDWDSNGSAHVNLKFLFENCIFVGLAISLNRYGFYMPRVANGGAFAVGGVIHRGCLFINCQEGIYYTDLANTTDVSYIYNTRFVNCYYGVNNSSGASGTIVIANSLVSACYVPVIGTVTLPTTLPSDSTYIFAGIHDYPLIDKFGWSPYGAPFTPIRSSVISDFGVDYGNAALATASVDMYGNPRQMGDPTTGLIYCFDGSDDVASDPDSAWFNEANAVSSSISDETYTTTLGSSSSNYLHAGGTNAPASGDSITRVDCRVLNYVTAGALGTLTVYTDGLGESLGSVTLDRSTALALPASMRWSDWAYLTAPAGGWTWAKVQGLEFKCWKSQAGTYVALTLVEIRVITADPGIDIGPVESNPGGALSTTWANDGTRSTAFTSTGYHEFQVPVDATETTITVEARKNSSYSGTAPKIEVLICDTSQGSDSLSVGADTTETLSVAFTPAAAGWARIRLWGYNTADGGECYFDTLTLA